MPKLVGKEVGKVGYGMMGLNARGKMQSHEQIAALRKAFTLGGNNWNSGEIYGTAERNSMHVINEYFTKYPGDADKVMLSVKGGMIPDGSRKIDGSQKNVRRSIDECLRVLDRKKFIDMFACARVDFDTPIEDTVSYIAEYVKAGKIGGVFLSEVGAATIRRAHKVHPISAVEVEFSLFMTEILENGVASTCAELGIPIFAYSPLGQGFLAGKYKKYSDLEPDSVLHITPRAQPDVFDNNLKLVSAVEELAAKKGVTPAQIAIGWVLAHSNANEGLPTIIPIPGATTESRIEENMKPAELDAEDMKALADILKKFPIKGERYWADIARYNFA